MNCWFFSSIIPPEETEPSTRCLHVADSTILKGKRLGKIGEKSRSLRGHHRVLSCRGGCTSVCTFHPRPLDLIDQFSIDCIFNVGANINQ
jgi:hypothetical protein